MSPDRSVRPIETQWNGHRFRSRLEARLAVFMDALDLGYRYELKGFDLGGGLHYLPGFYVPRWDAYLEIKAGLPDDAEILKAKTLARQMGLPVFLLFGDPWPDVYEAWRWHQQEWASGYRWSTCSRCWRGPTLSCLDPQGRTCSCREPRKDDVLRLQNAFQAARAARFEFDR